MRVASLAAERGRGAAFVLAAGRLAFCGGFDLDDPEILAEAAAAAGLALDECLARGARRAAATARSRPPAAGCWPSGADRLPALRSDARCSGARSSVGDAAAAARMNAAAAR